MGIVFSPYKYLPALNIKILAFNLSIKFASISVC